MHFPRFLVVAIFLTACSSAQKNGDQPDGGKDGGTSASVALNCAAILNCAAACADNDDACANACLANGSSDAQSTATALAQCYNDHACADAACLNTNCSNELDACFSQGKPTGTPLDPTSTTPGSVPANLVGSWAMANYGATNRFKFNADGTGYYQTSLTQGDSCLITENTTWDGTAVIDDTTITVYATTVTNTRDECGTRSQTSDPAKTLHFTYTYDASADALTVLDGDCAAQYPDSPSSAQLYCQNTLPRE